MTSSYQGQSPPTTYMHHHHHIRRHRVPSGGEDPEEEELDPRIQIELERLNRASEEINRLELELDDARAAFRTALSDSTQRLNGLAKKLGACVDKARPYYDARMKLKEAHLESQKAALRFERACSMHEAAKEMVQLAEEGYKRREQDLDPTWQEMLNHATMKVNDAERERIESEDFHQRTTFIFKHKEEEVQRLQKDLKRSITKSKPYFEMKAKFNQVMEERKRAVSRLEEDVSSTKALYSQALRSLEAISDDIHRQRLERRQKLELGVRGAGVGAESPSPPPWEKGSNIEGSASCQYTGDSDHGKYLPSVEKVHSAPLFTRPTGIICHETAFRKKASLTDNLLMDGKFKTDPLDVVVFKTSTASPKGGITSYTNSPVYDGNDSESPTEIYSYTNRARSASYRAAIELSSKPSVAKPNWSRNDSVVEGNEDTSSEATIPDCHPQDITQNEVVNDKFDRLSDSLTSPICDIEISQSSVRRAQEWVNKSPVPQQRSFVKSKSLIDASASHLSLEQQQNFNLSSSLTSEVFRGAAARYTADVPRPVAQLTYHPAPHSENTSDTICPPGSPSVHRKSPKLQGLILCVDPAGLVSSTSQISPNQTAAVSADQAPKPMISTQQLFFADKKTQLPMTTVPKPPSSLIAQQMNKMMNANKTAYTAKTVASTLSTSYSLAQPPISQPSPVYNSNQTPVLLTSGVSVRHHLTSPTPSSPSAERVSLSGRSDTLSASSSRGAFLKPPSDSSDTESIASTGPMLDDDQVELINMDFSEQSIGSEAVDDSAYFGEDRMPVPRGHWSRMSLPPRLSYLEGFLERARLYSSSAGQKNDDNFEDKAVSEDSTDSSPSYPDNSEPIDISTSRSTTVLNAEGKQNEDFCQPDNTIDLSGKKNGVNLSTPTATVIESSSVLSKNPQDNISTCDMKGPDTQTGQAVDKSDDSADSPNHLHNVAKDGSLPPSAAADWDKSEYFV